MRNEDRNLFNSLQIRDGKLYGICTGPAHPNGKEVQVWNAFPKTGATSVIHTLGWFEEGKEAMTPCAYWLADLISNVLDEL